ncbi:hypothetical protein B0I37DRAFT_371667 [Chaetomium sp. MPI-CAGE-AT-0009]|nr:hypothetical protein B0I37DRAFT_371667 [Chaetomium sp. MPI-CAGE-AT-0009]
MAQDAVTKVFDWGLKLLYDGSLQGGPKDPCLDIVLVHGLSGDREATWRTKNGSLWAMHELSKSIANLRVFAYGYASTPKNTCNRMSVHSIANNLLELLSTDYRDQPRFKYRPLIFAGHNLGGNIIKEVLVTGKGTDGGDYRDIYDSTRGVLFFATPHRGLDARTFNKLIMANKPWRVRFCNRAPSQLLNEMDQNDHRVGDLLSRFRNIADLKVVSLLEGSLVPGMKEEIVNDTSGTLGWSTEIETPRKLEADHIQMCKFGGIESDPGATNSEIEFLAGEIKRIVTSSPKADTFEDENRRALERLGVSKMQPGLRPVEPAEGTCESVAQECFDKLSAGAEDRRDTLNFSSLWVRGPKGCGKAHLAKHLAMNWGEYRHSGLPGPQRRAIVAHCSVSNMVTHYRTASSVAVCWLREALDAYPRSVRHLTDKYKGKVADNFGPYVCDWEEPRVVELWQEVILEVAKEVDLVFIVDGMDKRDDARGVPALLGWVAEVAGKAAANPHREAQFRVLVFSNDSEEFRHLNQFPVHQLTASSFSRDVKCAVRDRVKVILNKCCGSGEPHEEGGQQRSEQAGEQASEEADGVGDSDLEALVWETILDGEEKTHLWAAVLVGEIEAANFSNKVPLATFLKTLNNSPDGGKLDALYGTIIQRISLTGGGLARHSLNVLFWMMHHIGTMNAEELQTGCGMLDAVGYAQAHSGDGTSVRHIQEMDVERTRPHYTTLRRAVKNCGGLVKGWPRGLCLIHDSFRKYLTTHPETPIHQNYRCSQETADKVISSLCREYLLLPRFSNAGPSTDAQESHKWEDKVHRRVKENRFIRYASLRWTEHLQRAGSPFDPRYKNHQRRSQFRRLLDPGNGYMRTWTEVLWFWTRSAEGVKYPAKNFPWELFVWKQSRQHLQPEQRVPSLRPPPPGMGNAGDGQPISEYLSPETPKEGKGSKAAWLRKKRVRFIILALVVVVIASTVGGALGSQRSSQNNGEQQPMARP